MRLKSFEADTMTQAMALVKEAMGEDAIIISTREDKADKKFRVTAAIEEITLEQEAPLDFGEDHWDYDDEESVDALHVTLEERFDSFLKESRDYNNEHDNNDMFDDADLNLDRPDRSLTSDKEDIIDDAEEAYFENAFAIKDDEEEFTEDFDFFDWEMAEDDAGDLQEYGFIEPITEGLLRHNVPADIIDMIISAASNGDEQETIAALSGALDRVYNYAPLPRESFDQPIILIGAPGAGKTLTAAKIAARGVMNKLNVVVISTDTKRAGALEQLKAFTDVLDIPLIEAEDLPTLKEAIAMHADADQIIIDSAGTNPFDMDAMKELAITLKSTSLSPYLVMPAGGDPQENADIARAFGTLKISGLIPTRLDFARRYGGILCAAYMAKIPLSDGANTEQVVDGLFSINSDALAKILIPHLFDKKNKSRKVE